MTLEELGGVGVRWPAREQAANLPAPSPAGAGGRPPVTESGPRAPLKAGGAKLIAGSYRSIWAGPEVAASPALAFLHPRQRIEIGAADARRLGLADGAEMAVADASGTQIRARVAVRDGIAAGSAFLQRALAGDSAESLSGQTVEIVAIPDPPPPPPLHAEGASEREQADGDPGDSVDSIEEALA
jgi:NADH-quinone oxidoreductase subunit G